MNVLACLKGFELTGCSMRRSGRGNSDKLNFTTLVYAGVKCDIIMCPGSKRHQISAREVAHLPDLQQRSKN